jgi:hypothetical protein
VALHLPRQAVASLETLSITESSLGIQRLPCLGLAAWRCTTNRQGSCVMRLKRQHGENLSKSLMLTRLVCDWPGILLGFVRWSGQVVHGSV